MRAITPIFLCCTILALVGCDILDDTTPPEPTIQPSVTITVTASPTEAVTPTVDPDVPTDVPSATFPPSLTPSTTWTPQPPTSTPSDTPEPGPFEHQVGENQDCITILSIYGHLDVSQLDDFYALNNLSGCNISVGQTVLVPRPVIPDIAPPPADGEPRATSMFAGTPFFALGQYCAEEEDTLTSIALKNNTNPRRVCEMNPLPDGLDCRGCDFSVSNVYCPDPPIIQVSQCVNVPAATPTATNTLPPRGDETITPTPTLIAPTLISPRNGDQVRGIIRLQWVSVGRLAENEFYVVTLLNEGNQTVYNAATQATSITVPNDFLPNDGAAYEMVWSVAIEMQNADGLFIPSGGRTPENRFTWEG